jgi:hypothetical protein
MEAIELFRSRYSASKLGAPEPSAEAVEAMPVVQELAPLWAGDGHKSAIP